MRNSRRRPRLGFHRCTVSALLAVTVITSCKREPKFEFPKLPCPPVSESSFRCASFSQFKNSPTTCSGDACQYKDAFFVASPVRTKKNETTVSAVLLIPASTRRETLTRLHSTHFIKAAYGPQVAVVSGHLFFHSFQYKPPPNDFVDLTFVYANTPVIELQAADTWSSSECECP